LNKELHDKLVIFLEKLKNILDGKSFPFTVTLKDPSGNSYIESLNAPKIDP